MRRACSARAGPKSVNTACEWLAMRSCIGAELALRRIWHVRTPSNVIESVETCLIRYCRPRSVTGRPPEGLQSRARGVNKIVLRCENSLLHAGFCTAMVLYSIIIDLILKMKIRACLLRIEHGATYRPQIFEQWLSAVLCLIVIRAS